jgi:AmmeMemoRadiSam system protein B
MKADEAALWTGRVEKLVQALDENLMLENDRFRREILKRVDEFARATERPPRVTKDVDLVRIEALLAKGQAGAGRALIVPHIDYDRGGATYAAGYGRWKGRKPPARILILGTSHRPSAHFFAVTKKPFRTGLGRVPVDQAAVDALIRRYRHPLLIDEFLHRDEHSIELQLPFLQALFGEVPIVPILCGSIQSFYGRSPTSSTEVADMIESLAALLQSWGGETLIVASADWSHIGPYFGDAGDVLAGDLRRAEKADRALLGRIAGLDSEGFFEALSRDLNARRVCGAAPVYLLTRVLSSAGPRRRGTLLDYRQCLAGDRSRMVAVAAVTFD